MFHFLVWFNCTVLVLFIILRKMHKKMFQNIDEIPGPAPRILMGNLVGLVNIYKNKGGVEALVVAFQAITGIVAIHQKSQMFRIWLSVRPLVILFKSESVKELLTSTSELDKSLEYKFLDLWLGDGLLTGSSHVWKPWRKVLTSTFHSEVLRNYLPIFNKQSMILVEKLKSLTKEKFIDIIPLVNLCTLDIICETVMGIKINSQTENECQYEKSLTIVKNSFLYRSIRPWFWPDFLYFYISANGRFCKKNVKMLQDFTKQVIEKRRELMTINKNYKNEIIEVNKEIVIPRRKSFLDLLLEFQIEYKVITDKEICKQVDTFTFAGHDTTAAAMSWALYCIGLYPDIQNKIQKELYSIFGDDTNRPVTTDDMTNMKYLECVLKESMRLYPPVPIYGRHLNKDCKIGDYTVPKGTSCYVFSFMLHRDPEIYPNPEMFDPNRFLPENTNIRPQYSYMPFSGGPRNCIGQRLAMMTLKCVIANLLRHIRIQSVDPRDRLELVPNIILLPTQGLRVRISAKDSSDFL